MLEVFNKCTLLSGYKRLDYALKTLYCWRSFFIGTFKCCNQPQRKKKKKRFMDWWVVHFAIIFLVMYYGLLCCLHWGNPWTFTAWSISFGFIKRNQEFIEYFAYFCLKSCINIVNTEWFVGLWSVHIQTFFVVVVLLCFDKLVKGNNTVQFKLPLW